ncbi:DUF4336 domain-containing protein [Albimonas sp. CAU 1670]|uniref:DUF4336 domain-containing protein n=1 Tax=Albimonas sp. CAU 1670 TaxID=3032599 RepID=UPI0023D9BB4D|nr:DUF4336 domain-containing protein [Albimonas sp. CAU 1670]MDF2233850.1 DUF4336 domain-containing protein [Albimonas sp. CAU 1670]
MLAPFGTDLWLAEGPVVEGMAGFRFPTRMAVMRLGDAGLAVWSPVAPNDALLAEVEALGPVRWLLAPNDLHHLFLPDWVQAVPRVRVLAAPGVREKRPDMVIHAVLGEDPPPSAFEGALDIAPIRGNRVTTEVAVFHRASRTAIFTDLLQALPPGWFRGWRGLVAKLDLMQEAEPTVPRKFRMAFQDREAARASLAPVFDWPAERLVIAHGAPVERDAAALLKRAFGWL